MGNWIKLVVNVEEGMETSCTHVPLVGMYHIYCGFLHLLPGYIIFCIYKNIYLKFLNLNQYTLII